LAALRQANHTAIMRVDDARHSARQPDEQPPRRPIGRGEGSKLAIACLGALGLVAGACYSTPGLKATVDRIVRVRGVALQSETIDLHLARPTRGRPGTPLLLYATGDGGWRPADRKLFQALADWGYPVAGFAAPAYLRHFRNVPGLVTPAHVAEDYQRLVRAALEGLDLPLDTHLVLLGFSRGAGLAIVAATRPELRPGLEGVVVAALTDAEEHVHHRLGRSQAGGSPRIFEPFGELAAIGTTPVVVIQSTHDRYLSAAAARRLFGPDSEDRRLIAVEANGHTFGGAREELLQRVRESLAWIVKRPPAGGARSQQ
jgi:dienelactone hydrolase